MAQKLTLKHKVGEVVFVKSQPYLPALVPAQIIEIGATEKQDTSQAYKVR